jgi:hypothetical protein
LRVHPAYKRQVHMELDTTACSPLKVDRRFGSTRHLHLQGQRLSQARNQYAAGSKQSSAEACYSETSVTFNRLHYVISHNADSWVLKSIILYRRFRGTSVNYPPLPLI